MKWDTPRGHPLAPHGHPQTHRLSFRMHVLGYKKVVAVRTTRNSLRERSIFVQRATIVMDSDSRRRLVHVEPCILCRMERCALAIRRRELSMASIARKVIVLHDCFELCGLPQQLPRATHLLETISDAIDGVREVIGGVPDGCPISRQKPFVLPDHYVESAL